MCDIRHTIISIKNVNNHVIFEWIPGHCGIKGNDKADQIAKKLHKNATLTLYYHLLPQKLNTSLKIILKINGN